MSNRHYYRRYRMVNMEPMDESQSDNENLNMTSQNTNQDNSSPVFQESFTNIANGLPMQLKRSEMNKLIMDYLVHEGFREAAERFREEAGIEPSNLKFSDSSRSPKTIANSDTKPTGATNGSTTNRDCQGMNLLAAGDDISKSTFEPNNVETTEMLEKRVEVRRHLEDGDILKGRSLINLYYPELLDNQKDLNFKLQQQHLIELIRQQKIDEVLSYIHEHLSVDEQKDPTEMERTLALLAYENPDKSPYASLLHDSHRLALASEINDIILQETSGNIEPTKPRLVTLIKLLFWTQSELERKKIRFPKMTALVEGMILESKE